MVAEKFQIYSIKITANTFVSQKIESVYFYACPQAKLPPPPPGRRELPILPEQHFLKIFFPEEKGGGGERIMELKKLTKVSVSGFDKFHHLCNLYIFGLCFVVQ